MAKTIEELKEMIDSVIVENGRGQITGQGLNLVLNEMSDSLSEMGGGGGAYQVYISMAEELTEEQIAFNAQQFAIMEPKLQNKEFVQIGIAGDSPDYGFTCTAATAVIYGDPLGEGTNSIAFMVEGGMLVLNSDGTIIVAG